MAGETTAAKAQAASTDEKKAPLTVIVACKLPNGLRLQAFDATTQHLPVMGGGTRAEKVHTRIGEGFVVKGPAHAQNEGPRAPIVTGTGYALTFGCPKELWDSWLKAYENSDLVRTKQIYAYEAVADIEAFAKDHAAVESGLERLDPKKAMRGIAPFSAGPAQPRA